MLHLILETACLSDSRDHHGVAEGVAFYFRSASSTKYNIKTKGIKLWFCWIACLFSVLHDLLSGWHRIMKNRKVALIPRLTAVVIAGHFVMLAATANAGGSCDKKNGVDIIGNEYIAQICPSSDDDQIYYYLSMYKCQNNSIVATILDGSGSSTPHTLKESTQNGMFRVFSNAKGTHVIQVHKDYAGTLNLDGQIHDPVMALPSGAGCQEPAVVPNDLAGPGLPPCNATNPINPAWRGNKFEMQQDYLAEGSFPLHFTRRYNSRAVTLPHDLLFMGNVMSIGSSMPKDFAKVGNLPSPPVGNYIVGGGGSITRGGSDSYGIAGKWTHNYSMYVDILNTAVTRVAFYRADGSALMFGKLDGSWKPVVLSGPVMSAAPAIAEKLSTATNASGQVTEWNLTHAEDTVETYDATGRLIRLTAANGLRQTVFVNVVVASTVFQAAIFSGLSTRSGFSVTAATGIQSRVFLDHLSGCRRRAC